MKAMLYAVIGAVISGLALLFAQSYFQNKPLMETAQVDYEINESVVRFTKQELQDLSKKVSDLPPGLQVSSVSLKNSGNQPLPEQDVIVRVGRIGDGDQFISGNDDIFKVVTTSFPGKDPDALVSKISGDKLTIHYKVLNPGERHDFYIMHDGIGSVSVAARKPGLNLKQGFEAPTEPVDWLSTVLEYGLLIGVSFLAGITIVLTSISSGLKARGQDLDALLKLPKV